MRCNWRMTSRTSQLRMTPERVHKFLTELFAEDMHAARVLSLSNAVSGAIEAAALSVHAIGQGLALANQFEVKSAIKQVDRRLSNMKLSVWEVFPLWVAYLLSERSEAVVAYRRARRYVCCGSAR